MGYSWVNAPLTFGNLTLEVSSQPERLTSSPDINGLFDCKDVTQHLRMYSLSTFRRRKHRTNVELLHSRLHGLLPEAPIDIHVAVVGDHSIGKRHVIESYTRLLANSQPDSTTPLGDPLITVPADGDSMGPWTIPSPPSVSPAITHEECGRQKRLHLWHDSWGWQRPEWFHAKDTFIICFAIDERETSKSAQEVGHGISDDGAETRKDSIFSETAAAFARDVGAKAYFEVALSEDDDQADTVLKIFPHAYEAGVKFNVSGQRVKQKYCPWLSFSLPYSTDGRGIGLQYEIVVMYDRFGRWPFPAFRHVHTSPAEEDIFRPFQLSGFPRLSSSFPRLFGAGNLRKVAEIKDEALVETQRNLQMGKIQPNCRNNNTMKLAWCKDTTSPEGIMLKSRGVERIKIPGETGTQLKETAIIVSKHWRILLNVTGVMKTAIPQEGELEKNFIPKETPRGTSRKLKVLGHLPPIESWDWATTPMARGRRWKHGPTTQQRGIVQGSNRLTINGGNYANGDASTTTTIQYNLLVVNINDSPSLTLPASNALSLAGLFGYPSTTGV
ncbi:hypothetical protein BKA70DRAFT_1522102 [Coprinopsis sp. MPI-PUGE-AT-0042]|nr:hypothetical protein BKA70DRAFT_1522102 [Coprinopsis sp. MPI-PUGE-AT-0042]